MDKDKIKDYQEYYSDDMIAIEDQIDVVDSILQDIVKDVERFKSAGPNTKGGGMLKVETYRNLLEAASKKQSILKDKFSWKTKIVDLAAKDAAGDKGGNEDIDIANEVKKLLSTGSVPSVHNQPIKKQEELKGQEVLTNDDIMDKLDKK